MRLWGKFFGFVIGFMFGRFFGALLGLWLGHLYDKRASSGGKFKPDPWASQKPAKYLL